MDKDVALALLGLSEDELNDEKIEKARQDALQSNQSDLHCDNEELRTQAEEKCKQINEAHDVLKKELQESDVSENQACEDASLTEKDPANNSESKTLDGTNDANCVQAEENQPVSEKQKNSNDSKSDTADDGLGGNNGHRNSVDSNRSSSSSGNNISVKASTPAGLCESKCSDNEHLDDSNDESTSESPGTKNTAEIKAPEGGEEKPVQPDTECVIESKAPLLDTWKTSESFSFFGFVGGLILWGALGFVESRYIGFFIGSILNFIIYCLYSTRVYTTFFGKHPIIRSNYIASFFNFAVGGLIFGAIWNHNLTIGRKGISYIVLIVLNAAALVFIVFPMTYRMQMFF